MVKPFSDWNSIKFVIDFSSSRLFYYEKGDERRTEIKKKKREVIRATIRMF